MLIFKTVKQKQKKCQVAMEFILIITILLTVFIVFEIFILKETKDISQEKEYNAIKDLSMMIQSEIMLASKLQDGYIREMKLPDTVQGVNYSTLIYDNHLVVTSRNHEYVLNIPEINGAIEKGTNIIEKKQGKIYITQE